ncbi:DUF533 domain-containing protein [Paracoccus sp. S-4012]|uniref:tellurite resistance TerB family protein n=1 Tax=Paracoccus sp. S-4012 TaxID=2665648 RepID=UPI0012B1131D|nr:tellurite resistance TerB family protein [Paracoccus sp. S-4012]MRX52249.1 DUF533 domain-containing protein [Paracoccus sp. S-4012]
MSSMMKTLARVAAGVMLAKGIGTMMENRQRQDAPGQQGRMRRTTGGGILGDLLNQSGQSRSGGSGQGVLGGMLGQVLGGHTGGSAGTGRRYGGPNSQGASGGLGGILDNLTRGSGSGSRTGGSGGGLDSILGGLAGGAAAGGLGGVLGDLLGGRARSSDGGALAQHGAQPRNDATFGEVFNDALVRQDEPEVAPTPEQNAVAGLMLKAMIQSAKADGRIDEQERQRLLGQLGDIDADEQQFIREQMAAPVDPRALAREVPKGLEAQVYLMSLMAMDFDDEREAQYLHDLAEAMGLERQAVNRIHQEVGVQNLYG